MDRRQDQPPSLAKRTGPFRIADWIVDADANRLLREGRETRLEPRVMSVLVYLARHPGEVVSREELEQHVWRGTVVGYDAITNAVIKLRRALRDDARSPHIIETISKHGYRLIANVQPAPGDVLSLGPTREAPPRTSWSEWLPSRRLLPPMLGALGLLIALVFGAAWVLRDLPQATTPTPQELPSIAVLPFEDRSPDVDQAYFANGITEDLITDLSKVAGLLVVARNSAFAYADSTAPPGRIGRELDVRYLLRGSVRRTGRQLRLNAWLIATDNERTLWAERYDAELSDIFRLQDELTARIVAALEIELAPADRRQLSTAAGASVAAYDALLRGLDHYGRRSFEDNELAKSYYEQAIALDPDYARAYAALALAHSRDAVDGWDEDAPASLAHAAALVEQARNLDPNVPQIYFVRGQIDLHRRDFSGAVRQAEHAIALSPSYADAHALLAWVLHFAGRPAEGLKAMQSAVRLNPQMPSIYRLVRGALRYAVDDAAGAIDDLERAVAMNPTHQMLRLWLAATYANVGRIADARWQTDELLTLSPGFTLNHIRERYPIRDPDYLNRLITDLRKAGLQ